MSSYATVMTEMLLFLLRLLRVSFLALGFLISFLSSLGGAPKIDLPLSTFSCKNSSDNAWMISGLNCLQCYQRSLVSPEKEE